ncbi:MAG: HAD family hydrolase [Halioglobus sp.]|nr:HAD family hydrolase [Halioglobus sp.]
MELVVFDLDGTLLNGRSEVSDHTRETLRRLRDRDIAYTVATGRTLHASLDLLAGHGFELPHIYKNGVVVWHPQEAAYSHRNLLTNDEIRSVLGAFTAAGVSPFIFTLDERDYHAVYHPPLRTDAERRLAQMIARDRGLDVFPVADLPGDVDITNISALGSPQAIAAVRDSVSAEDHLVAYGGPALEGEQLHWLDVHHSAASKGGAIDLIKRDLGVSRVICFGDSDNDLSMFQVADECYAPSNAKDSIKRAATAVIGHHDEEGISEFLRSRFKL